MLLSIRNKQLVTLIIIALLTVLAIVFFVLSLAHINMWQALHVSPNIIFPYN